MHHFRLGAYAMALATGAAMPLSYETKPLGSEERPLLLRTYVADPGLDPKVFANHGKASKSPKYNPKQGKDVGGEYKMMKVIPAAIAVNHGPALSYVWDTTECRLLYAWQGGFLDMFPYWGEENQGSRRSFDYGPRLIGNLFHLAQPEDRAKPKFLGYDLSAQGVPTFRYRLGDKEHTETILPGEKSYTFRRIVDGKESIVGGKLISKHHGFERNLKIGKVNAQAGEKVFAAYGCVACHSIDGSAGHGPSLQGLAGSSREIEEGKPVVADAAYLTESILKPHEKTAKGYPKGYMPPYKLSKAEIESLVAYIQSLAP